MAAFRIFRHSFKFLLFCICIWSLYLCTSLVKQFSIRISFKPTPSAASSNIIVSTMLKTTPAMTILATPVTKISKTSTRIRLASPTRKAEKSSTQTTTTTTKTTVASTATRTIRKPKLSEKASHEPLIPATTPYSCSFPVLDPFDSIIEEYIYKHDPLTCDGKPSVADLEGDVIRINKKKVIEKNVSLQFCRYSPLKLPSKGDDMELEDLKWSSKFKTSQEIPEDLEHLVIRCEKDTETVAESFKSRIFEKPEVEKRSQERYAKHVKEKSPAETLSIMFVGVDGMSKNNFARAMPKTKNFLLETMHARELNMFNKVGDNTFPNVIVLLTGRTHFDFLKLKGWNMKEDYFDSLDHMFVWNAYQNAGYRTACIFDETWGTAFHYLKMGWKTPPFDYYHRPVPLILEKLAKNDSDINCAGDQRRVSLLLDYYLQLTAKFNNTKTKPYFAYSFFTRLTHDDENYASKGDEMYLEFFTKLHNSNVLNNTVLIFFSDHGPRFGPIRQTYNGFVEGRSPYIFFMFPSWFEKKYQEEMKIFETNQNRLTTFFDIHATLNDILHFKGKKTKDRDALRGTSLFQEIPTSRTCQDAHIPVEYCLCKGLSNKEIPETVQMELAFFLVDMINERTDENRDICERLSLQTIRSVISFKSEFAGQEYYKVTLQTMPGGGDFEALLNVVEEEKMAMLVGNIVRLNLYKGQDGCVDSLNLKPYCYCRDSS